ncbi:superoxide dismutase [Oleiharenicola lentus]|uniref:superoxide dismutase n=1 Tax=Oleiharenicola lentus TaxID=2508720 RepID=UPI003F6612D8
MKSENPSSHLSRRDALKFMGLGLAAAGIGFSRGGAAEISAAGVDGWVLPKLPYAYDALEPHIDARTMEIHHSKHHQAYINAGKAALEKHPDLLKLTPEQLVASLGSITVPEATRTTLRNQAGGHVNHTFFWKIIAPGGGGVLPEALGEDINKTFGSLDELKKQFNDAAAKRFGSGWAWLSLKDAKLVVHSTANQDSPLTEGATPIIGLDVWEHAYYLKYQNMRADYTKAFWSVVNWTQAGENYAAAKKV